MTHPFHPLFGEEFEFLKRRKSWGADHVFFYNHEGQLVSLPAEWTDVVPPDPFVVISGGRSPFHIDDHPRLGLWLDTSAQTPRETVDEILSRRSEASVDDAL